ncbi:MAG: biopolymer transporter ExbD [candidate division WOR-3 bacterium]
MPQPRKRVSITLDMTPMVDIGFLLVIFFMSTYHARPPETVRVDLPMSRSPLKVPEKHVIILHVLPPERAWQLTDSFNPTLIRANYRKYLDEGMRPNLAIDRVIREMREEPRIRDAVISEAKRLTPAQRAARRDSMLLWWNTGRDAAQPLLYPEIGPVIQRIRIEDDSTVLVIKTDSLSESGSVLQLMEKLQQPDVNMLRFSLVTWMKGEVGPTTPAATPEPVPVGE